MKIKFTADALHEVEGRGKGKHYKEGKVYDLPDDQAQRWIRRNAAEVYEGESKKVDEAEQVDESPKPVADEPVHPAVEAAAKVPDGQTPEERATEALESDAQPEASDKPRRGRPAAKH